MENIDDDGNQNLTTTITGTSGGSSSARLRGHQHHIRFTGNRRSKVLAEEVIAALRSGDPLPVKEIIQRCDSTTQHSGQQQATSSDIEMNLAVDNDNNNLTNSLLVSGKFHKKIDDSKTSDSVKWDDDVENDDDTAMQSTDVNRNRPPIISKKKAKASKSNANSMNSTTLIDNLNANTRLDNVNVQSASSSDQKQISTPRRSVQDRLTNKRLLLTSNTPNSALSSDVSMDESIRDDQDDSVSSGSSSSIVKETKSRRDGSGARKKSSKKSDADASVTTEKKEKRSKRSKIVPPCEERPPLEGADADQFIENNETGDMENDPEAAEWSKLRCTSERTEVVAEREYRRQNRRCADYPGLAFGRSIFSSDTMMKLNIIRNELHNIMKTQLKRVRVCWKVNTDIKLVIGNKYISVTLHNWLNILIL